jgi:hypothetical protein
MNMLNLEELINELHTVQSYATKSAMGGDFRLFVQWGSIKLKKGRSKKAIDVVSTGWFRYGTEDEEEFTVFKITADCYQVIRSLL